MAFVDELTLHMKAGKGGNGVVRWLHEKFKEFSGPSGGNGGRGGSVYVRGVRDTWLLSRYRHATEFVAESGQDGANQSRYGAAGEDLYIDFPIGSILTNTTSGDIYRLEEEGQTILILEGGRGGLGNEHFKASTNVYPLQSTKGKPGEEADFHVEVEIIASAGLIGLPNAGKSSLLNALTRAEAKVGNYQFTTLEPNLGDLYGYILADIPGLIEGASEGKGLGHKFLKHIRRTKMLLHCISIEQSVDASGENDTVNAFNPDGLSETYRVIRNELKSFDPELAEKKEILIVTKSDTLGAGEAEARVREWLKKDGVVGGPLEGRELGKDVFILSIYDLDTMKAFSDFLVKVLK